MFGRVRYNVFGDLRTLEGTLTCAVISILIFLWFEVPLVSSLLAGAFLALIENVSIRGIDNVTMPLAAGYLFLLVI